MITALEALAATRGPPHTIAVENGTEFTSQALDISAERRSVHLEFSRPGKPNDNAFIGFTPSAPTELTRLSALGWA